MGVMATVDGLPDGPLDAAAEFHAIHLPRIRHDSRAPTVSSLVVVFEAAGHEHRGWRLAAIQELAREFAPMRVNGVAGDDPRAVDEATCFFNDAPGITGQLVAV
jgi:hypothetical protein